MGRSRSVRKGKVWKDFKDRREYQTPVNPKDFPDPPHYALMPDDVKEMMNQDMDKLTRKQVDDILRINKQYLKEYNRRTYS
jgi:hypothetical protein